MQKILLTLAIACQAFASSNATELDNSNTSTNTDLQNHAILSEEQKAINHEIERFSTTLAQIKTFYIYDMPYKDLITNSLKGMASRLDPHSNYLTEDEWNLLNNDATGEYVGIGVSIIPEDGLLRVISAIDNSPAKAAGIKSNDVIFKVGNDLISNIGIEAALKKIQGKPDTKVSISVFTPSTKSINKLSIKRKRMDNYPITSKMINHNLLYARLPMFTEKSAQELRQVIKQNQADGLILDLRNNPGGILSAAVDVSDLFLDQTMVNTNKKRNGTIVAIKGRIPEYDAEFTPTAGDILQKKPIFILINHGSASASEIVAGALQSYHRAIILGTDTFGKGSVQTVLPNHGSALKITTALYYLPDNRAIQGYGIHPDIKIKQIKTTKVDQEKNMLEIINEASYSNAIKPQNMDTADQQLNSQELENLAYNDFQLYQAAKILETVIVERKYVS